MYNNQEESIRAIMRKTGHSYETVKKYIEMEDFNERKKIRAKKPLKISPVKEIVDSWLSKDLELPRKQRHSAKRIYDRLQSEYPNMYKGSYRSIAVYIAEKKKEIKLQNIGYLPLEHNAYEAQVDFGEAVFIENGKEIKGKYLVMTFPKSNGGYIQLFKGENQECLLNGMRNIFEYINCVPKEIWFDNMSTAVTSIKKEGKRIVNKGFAKFALHYGFEAKFCNPSSGNEKGNVENKVGYFRRNYFVPIPTINNLKEFNEKLLEKSDRDMDRKHYKLEKKIRDLFEEDKKSMLSLNPTPYEIFKLEALKADKYGKIQFETNTYSVSPDYASTKLILKVAYDKVTVMDLSYKQLIVHNRIYGKNKESMNWIPYLDLISKRPTALKYTGIYKELPKIWQEYIEDLDYLKKKEAIKTLKDILIEKDMLFAEKVLQYNLAKGVKDIKSLMITYYALTENSVFQNIKLKLPKNTPELIELEINLKEYDELMSK